MIKHSQVYGIDFIEDTNLKNTYSCSMYENMIKFPKFISIIDDACSKADSIVKQIRKFYKLALVKGFSEKEIQEVAMTVWKMDECDYADCF